MTAENTGKAFTAVERNPGEVTAVIIEKAGSRIIRKSLFAEELFSHAYHVLEGVQRILEILPSARDAFVSNQSVVTECTAHRGYLKEGFPAL